jgi:hypothetical protein
MATELSEYNVFLYIDDGIEYLNICQKSEFYRRLGDRRLPSTVKNGGRRHCIKGELREIKNAYMRSATDAEIVALVKQMEGIRPLLSGRSDAEIMELVRALPAVNYQPQDAVTPRVGDTLEDAAQPREPPVRRSAARGRPRKQAGQTATRL